MFLGRDREHTDALLRMEVHYCFTPHFCNPRSGCEKGKVERSVEYIRRRAFSLEVRFNSLEAAQTHLAAICDRLNTEASNMSAEEKRMRIQADLAALKENRSENQRRHRIKNAGFPQLRYLNEIDTDALPADARKVLPALETLDFIKNGRNLILYGNPGTGKTHLATALGIAACNAGHSVLFTSVPRLPTQIRECRNALTLRSLENKFERYDMVICDEFGYVSCDKAGAEMLFNHLSLRTDKKTTVVTTNLAFNRWNEIIDDKVLVTAMVDRLTHKAILLNMTGKSYRMKETQEVINQQI